MPVIAALGTCCSSLVRLAALIAVSQEVFAMLEEETGRKSHFQTVEVLLIPRQAFGVACTSWFHHGKLACLGLELDFLVLFDFEFSCFGLPRRYFAAALPGW